MDPAHDRGQRDVGRLSRARLQDHRAERGACQDHVPAGAESGSRRGRRAGEAPPGTPHTCRSASHLRRQCARRQAGRHRARSLGREGRRGCAREGVWREAAHRAHGRHGAGGGNLPTRHGPRDGVLLVLDRRRGFPLAQRILPRAPAARRARRVGAPVGPPGEAMSDELARAEAQVEARSAELKKVLGVRDLALTQILFIIGLTWIGVAGKLGPSHVVLWLLAAGLFYLPCTVVVIWLNQLMPLEGGLYQWAKLGFNQTLGFLVAWNLWLYVILFASELGLTVATYLSYALGPSAAWMTTSAWFVSLASALAIALLATLAFLGLSLGKWVHNAGGIFMIAIFAVLILLPLLGLATGHLQSYHPFRTEMPALSLFNLNVLGKMCVGAFAGFEYMAILAGETHAP